MMKARNIPNKRAQKSLWCNGVMKPDVQERDPLSQKEGVVKQHRHVSFIYPTHSICREIFNTLTRGLYNYFMQRMCRRKQLQ